MATYVDMPIHVLQAIVRGNALWEAGAQSAVLLAGFSADDQAALKHSLYKRLQSGYASTARQYAGRVCLQLQRHGTAW